MRYYTYNEPGDDGSNITVTVSEEEILEVYKPYFLRQMKRITGDTVGFPDEEIIDQWVVINWAWETDIDGNTLKGIK